MGKDWHEIRDPIHGFVRFSTEERDVINSRPFQRLRHIRQLAMSSYVYPGATHSRFEHSLGVMELATRIYDSVTNPEKLSDPIKEVLPQVRHESKIKYWRNVVRMAALCHDLGYLPFSHGAEVLLPTGMTHEKLSWDIICSPEMQSFWKELHLEPLDIAKIALGQKEIEALKLDVQLSTWENIVAEIIVGNMFGADRMDYLLRDSYHAGVSYGHFDHERLVHTLRILPKAPEGDKPEDQGSEPCIGVERGGIHAAAGLIWARYSMFSQVYFHHVRRSYDMHLIDLMRAQFPQGFPITLDAFLAYTDNEVLAYLREATYKKDMVGHEAARRIEDRRHFRMVCKVTTPERSLSMGGALACLYHAGVGQWGSDNIRECKLNKKAGHIDFPVQVDDRSVQTVPAVLELPFLADFPAAEAEYIFVEPRIATEAQKWFDKNREKIISELTLT